MTDRMPGATWLPLPEANAQGRYTKTQLIFHSTGTRAGARANRNYFAQSGVKVESTFIVDYDGEIVQAMPASARADANGLANKRAMSVEMVGEAGEPFTRAQVAAAIKIAEWACSTHPVARRRINAEGASGIGWHVMFGAPGPWTSVRGKECPGPQRIRQVIDLIIPAVSAAPAPTPEDDDMAASFTFNDGQTTYWRDGGDTVPIPSMDDVRKLHAAGVKDVGQLSAEMTRRLVAAAKQ